MHDFVHKNNARPKYKEILFLTVTAIRTDSRDEGDEGEDEDENEDDDPLPAGNLLSGGLGGDQGGDGTWAAGGGGLTGKFQGFQWSCSLPIPC